jgi:rubrerythrin
MGTVSLRVQARDTKGNVIAAAQFADAEWQAAFRTANQWIGVATGMAVEFTRTPDETWTCGDCGVQIYDMLAEACALCGAARIL